jgi:hypothetical protein
MMLLLIRNKAARAAVQLAHASAMRSTKRACDGSLPALTTLKRK